MIEPYKILIGPVTYVVQSNYFHLLKLSKLSTSIFTLRQAAFNTKVGYIFYSELKDEFSFLNFRTTRNVPSLVRENLLGHNREDIECLHQILNFLFTLLPNAKHYTGQSLSEALLFAEHGENMFCTKIVLNVRNNFCTQHVLPRFELGIFMH